MIFSNDETDKTERQENYILTVFLLPIIIALAICGIFYLASHQLKIASFDSIFGYYFAFLAGVFIHGFNKRYWLKMPDGTFHNIKGVASPNKVSLHEPHEYEEEYFVSKKEKIMSIFFSIIMIVAAVFLGIKGTRGMLLPSFIGGGGIFMAYTGITAILDKTPRLKLARQGLWTAKLGFIDWNDITRTQVVVEKSGRSRQTILEIYLKGTVFADANKPDEKLNITAVENKEFIETVIDNLIFKRNALAG